MSKKLLSVLVVLALALSMIPMVGLPATEAEAATFNNANLKDANKSTAGMQAVCPHCAANGDSAVKTWTALSKNSVIGNVAAGEHHYYMAEDVNVTSTSRYLDVPPWCESILCVKVEAVQGKQVPLEWTETSGGLWKWLHDPGVPLAFPVESASS